MAARRIKDIATTITTPNADDYIAVDGATAGTRKTLLEPIMEQFAGLSIVIDGGGSVITTGGKGTVEVPFDCDVVRWSLFADQVGSIVIDVWRDIFANYPPTVADSITGSGKPTLAGTNKANNLSAAGWTTTLNHSDVLRFNVDSAATVTRVTLNIRVRRRVV